MSARDRLSPDRSLRGFLLWAAALVVAMFAVGVAAAQLADAWQAARWGQ